MLVYNVILSEASKKNPIITDVEIIFSNILSKLILLIVKESSENKKFSF